MYDMIVIGGGPAGMTAALYALRNGKTVLVLEKHGFGGQITHSPKVENYPGTLQMSGNEFADRFLEQILHQGADIELERAVSVKTEGGMKIVETEEGGRYEAWTVVIATGVKHRMLGLEGENELVGEGISFCAVCDGDFYTDKTVCVAGGGNSALQEAILLAEKCKEVIILQDLPALTGEMRLQQVLESRKNVRVLTNLKINKLLKNGEALAGVEVENRTTGQKPPPFDQGARVAVRKIRDQRRTADDRHRACRLPRRRGNADRAHQKRRTSAEGYSAGRL